MDAIVFPRASSHRTSCSRAERWSLAAMASQLRVKAATYDPSEPGAIVSSTLFVHTFEEARLIGITGTTYSKEYTSRSK